MPRDNRWRGRTPRKTAAVQSDRSYILAGTSEQTQDFVRSDLGTVGFHWATGLNKRCTYLIPFVVPSTGFAVSTAANPIRSEALTGLIPCQGLFCLELSGNSVNPIFESRFIPHNYFPPFPQSPIVIRYNSGIPFQADIAILEGHSRWSRRSFYTPFVVFFSS
jgi:hypothetical protein